MNFNTLTATAKLHKKLQLFGTGQMVASGDVPHIAVLCALDENEGQKLIELCVGSIKVSGGTAFVHNVARFGYLNKINPMTAKYARSFFRVSSETAEALAHINMFDGAVIITDCEITASGLLAGLARANCPTLILPLGAHDKFCPDILNITGEIAGKKINAKKAEDIVIHSATFSNTKTTLNRDNAFFLCAETMGFTVPNASLNPKNSHRQFMAATKTGEQITTNARNLLAPKKLLTRSALCNAVSVALSLGCPLSTFNTLLNLVAPYDSKAKWDSVLDVATKVKLLANEEITADTVLNMGGILSLVKQLSQTPKIIDENAFTYNGERLKMVLPQTTSADIASFNDSSNVVSFKGTACENYAIAKLTERTPTTFSGKAWVYTNLEDADKAIFSGSIPSESVIVLHNCQDVDVSAIAHAVSGAGHTNDIAILTDGICGNTDVLVLTSCTPNSYQNEAFANIITGDAIDIDTAKGRVNTSILAKDLKTRIKKNTIKTAPQYFGA